MKIYISGPITGKDVNEAQKAFKAAEKKILAKGHIPVNPFDIEKEMEGTDRPWVEFMRDDIPMLVHCDAILFLPGWIYSAGCKVEFDIARGLHMLMYENVQHIPYTMELKRELQKERKAHNKSKTE